MSMNENELEELRKRVEQLESQMVYLYRSLGISTREAPRWQASDKVKELVGKGDTNSAIRIFREESGASLKDAKIFIDTLAKIP